MNSEEIEEQKVRLRESMKQAASVLTGPSSDSQEYSSRDLYTLRGASTEPHITYVQVPVDEEDKEDEAEKEEEMKDVAEHADAASLRRQSVVMSDAPPPSPPPPDDTSMQLAEETQEPSGNGGNKEQADDNARQGESGENVESGEAIKGKNGSAAAAAAPAATTTTTTKTRRYQWWRITFSTTDTEPVTKTVGRGNTIFLSLPHFFPPLLPPS
jgi:hypothetical protein